MTDIVLGTDSCGIMCITVSLAGFLSLICFIKHQYFAVELPTRVENNRCMVYKE